MAAGERDFTFTGQLQWTIAATQTQTRPQHSLGLNLCNNDLRNALKMHWLYWLDLKCKPQERNRNWQSISDTR
eukprot:scaffold18985_cov67-Cyclotella_meneghiniana.AAC.1